MKKFIWGIGLLFAGSASAATFPPVTNSGAAAFISAGGIANRTLANRASDTLNVMDFGAVGNGTVDDSGAINAAVAYGRAHYIFNNSPHFKLFFPQGHAFVVQANGLNWDGFTGRGFEVDGGGSTIICKTTGKICIEMMSTQFARVHNLDISGDATNLSSVGIALGRTSDTDGAANNVWDNVNIYGSYSFAGMYQFSTETNNFYGLKVANSYTGGSATSCFALVQDGINHWNLPLQYMTQSATPDRYHSFNEDNYYGVQLQTAWGCTPLWSANTRRHYIQGYIASGTGTVNQSPAASPHAVILYSNQSPTVNLTTGDQTTDLTMDVHFETGALTDEFFITGPNSIPNFPGFRRREHGSNATVSVFNLDTNITAATANGIDLDYSPANGLAASAVIFQQPLLWTVSGHYSLPPGSNAWNLPSAAFTGVGTIGSVTTYSGDGSLLSGVTSNLSNNLQLGQATNTGSVTALTVVGGGHYDIEGWRFHTGAAGNPLYAHLNPTVVIASPGVGGIQATAVVSGMTLGSNAALDSNTSGQAILPSNPGTGYAVNDVLTLSMGTTGVCSVVPKVKVLAQSGGLVSQVGVGVPGLCSTVPSEPISVTGGNGSGLTLSGLTWQVGGLTVTGGGAGYTQPPSVTIQASSFNPTSTATATGTILPVMNLSSGAGQLVLDGTGTKVGTQGTNGAPTISLGALVDGSGIRQTLTGTPYSVPLNTSLVRFVQTSTVTSQTINLPANSLDGQSIQFDNYAGQITGLTFSPAVNGWINGSTFNSNSGLRIRWDNTANSWQKE